MRRKPEITTAVRRGVAVLLGICVLVLAGANSAKGAESAWVPFDCNQDGFVNVGDVTFMLHTQFLAKTREICLPPCDVDEDGRLSVNDAIVLIFELYLGNLFLPPPFLVPEGGELCDGFDNDCDGVADEGCVHDRSSSVLLTWRKVTTDANGKPKTVLGYRVYAGEKPRRNYLWVRKVPAETEYTFKHLRPETRYYFAVTAYDRWGNESAFSEEEPVDTR